MLKQLELDTRRAMQDFKTLVELRGDESITEAEASLLERLAHRHGDVTTLFEQIKAVMEQMLQQMQGGGEQDAGQPGRGRGR
jgi:TRAP-type C4-dicarboxylate transport system substrate-binding protein